MSTTNSGLFYYLQATQRFLREARMDLENIGDLTEYVNRARREVAMRSQCIRRLTPICGPVISITLTAGGTGYSAAPTVTITAPDFPSGTGANPNGAQATATAIVIGGQIQSISVVYGGDGYFQPLVTITDATGTGATATANVAFVNKLTQGREVYNFADIDLTMFPGVESVYMIKSLSILYSNYRYSLPVYDFSTYQAMIRQWSNSYQYIPTFAAQYGQGASGSYYTYPPASQTYQLEMDCFCLPIDLIDDQSVEAIPKPWSEAVPYFAAHLAFLELTNLNAGKFYFDMFDTMIQRYSNYARPGRVINPYGRYVLPFILGAIEILQHIGPVIV